MRLCIVTHKIRKGDGQGRVNYEVAMEALRRGHNLTLLASEIAPELEQNRAVDCVEIPVKGYPTEFIRNFLFAKKSGDWLRQNRAEIDLIKANGAITMGVTDVNAVHFVHSSWWRYLRSHQSFSRNAYGLYQWLYTAMNAYWEKLAFRQTQVVVAVSANVAEELVNIGVPRAKIRVIVNGVDLQEFSPGVTCRQELGLPENVTLALFAGDIRISRKNLDTVLHALVHVPDLHLAVVGETKDSPYPQMATALQLSERVHFLGYRHDMPLLQRASDFFVFPSRYEPFGLVVIEAMASGLPVITAKTTGAADLVTPSCGIVVSDCDDVDALADALTLLNSDRTIRQQMGKAARTIAEQHSWTTMAQTYVDIFEELIKNEEHSTHPHLSPSARPIALPYRTASPN
ncbi:glycosyltransferase family 4 protein [Anabaena cylindrica FACHB-243]|uniref:Glycosyl transferase group 1 n=1 Tax=Anabaena cylindrica (strain ATCC 27899 / PCC 7122) TaxID=272123 RepID=K9ZBX1_ANACC|nr:MULTISPECIES: glycosyltransferase family 4 protein [Anabaena]AFZ55880.1 glycosyl transferase group 1 [Anabaena cylindrica PCC 7122]MBD2421303.1 glycosyltransferase family 4 protein [Anabaena cylindrica FACHB-243]MBY5280873.1 glycosyltransferase family 4 protein [Anabaena sp. CCAP 1446/1C]MBY5309997.1 glycosyltransferase family 4 protein [Anabaena sp. CCAP 1446/1C]MCM2406635.1 glycosyltransferase family 4 protein [Anabaena sp. CCAP 1446/1C]